MANITSITGAGHYTIYQCFNSHLSWRTASKDWYSSSLVGKASPTSTVIPTKVIVTTLIDTNVPTISRCDKVVVIPTASVTPISLTFSEPWTSTISGFPTSVPACGFKEHQCDQAWSAYSVKTYSVISSIYSAHFAQRKPGLPGLIQFGKVEPPCPQPLQTCPPNDEVASCKLEAHRATVYYWPTSVSADFCASNITPKAQPPVQGNPSTAIYEQFTITSPSPLVIIPSVTRSVLPPATMVAEESDIVYRACGYAKEIKMQLDPANFSSIRTVMTPTKTVRHNYTFSTQYSSTTSAFLFNFADLAEARVPWQAFIGAGNCLLRDQNLCNSQNKTILPDQYKPQVSLGTAGVQTAEPSWAGCTIPNLRDNVQFVPITASVVTAPSITHWGATVNVGPKTPRLEPSPTGYIYVAEETPDTTYQPWEVPMDDYYGSLAAARPVQEATDITAETGVMNLSTTHTT
jgi:hypothetical protein